MDLLRRRTGRRRFRIGMRGIAGIAAALCLGVALLGFWLAWDDHRTGALLRDHGAFADGRFLRTETSVSDSTDSRGRTSRSTYHYGIWSYRVNGRRYEVQDRGVREGSSEAMRPVPAPGTLVRDHVVYLPEAPGTARLRSEIDGEVLGALGFGAFFLLFALVFGGAALFLLKPRRGLAL